jgi:hypothetical protein
MKIVCVGCFRCGTRSARSWSAAAADGKIATFARVLGELDPINVEFISLASQHLGELVRADARTGNNDSQPALNRAA